MNGKIILVLIFFFSFITIKAQTPSITQGSGNVLIADLMPSCPSNHITPLGYITSTDGEKWLVPTDSTFLHAPYLADLYNSCNGITPSGMADVNTSTIPLKIIDEEGEIITGYLFADNYFELFVNDNLIGVDPVPFTPFNSCIVKFKVKKPYTIALKLVDWEEHVGLGLEIQNSNNKYHPGDGGFIAKFSDGTVTDASWKAQSFYIAPLQFPSDVVELPSGVHDSSGASNTPNCEEKCYALHYELPGNWTKPSFDDQAWPNAYLYDANQVTNQPAFTNFANKAWENAEFIWTSNLILDNVVLTRKTVGSATSSSDIRDEKNRIVCNLDSNILLVNSDTEIFNATISLYNISGQLCSLWSNLDIIRGNSNTFFVNTDIIKDGYYIVHINNQTNNFYTRIFKK